jgi:hypothetical protein
MCPPEFKKKIMVWGDTYKTVAKLGANETLKRYGHGFVSDFTQNLLLYIYILLTRCVRMRKRHRLSTSESQKSFGCEYRRNDFHF